jgi:hypothetical protein
MLLPFLFAVKAFLFKHQKKLANAPAPTGGCDFYHIRLGVLFWKIERKHRGIPAKIQCSGDQAHLCARRARDFYDLAIILATASRHMGRRRVHSAQHHRPGGLVHAFSSADSGSSLSSTHAEKYSHEFRSLRRGLVSDRDGAP